MARAIPPAACPWGPTNVSGQLLGGVWRQLGDLEDHVTVGLHRGSGDRAQPVVSHVVQLGQFIPWKEKEHHHRNRTCSGKTHHQQLLRETCWVTWPTASAMCTNLPGSSRSRWETQERENKFILGQLVLTKDSEDSEKEAIS